MATQVEVAFAVKMKEQMNKVLSQSVPGLMSTYTIQQIVATIPLPSMIKIMFLHPSTK